MTSHSQKHGNCGQDVYAIIYADSSTYYSALIYVYVPAELKNINAVPLEQYDEDYSRPNADLETIPQIKSREQGKHMYPEWLDDIGEFNI